MSVPVFPMQISWRVAHVYMLSKFVISIPSPFNLSKQSAIASFVARGSPSGIATNSITIEIIAILPVSSIVSFEHNL